MEVVGYISDFIEKNGDPRTSQWFLSGSPGALLTILVTYLYFCIHGGPRYMRDRKPYELKYTMRIYNILQVFVSAYLFNEALQSGWWNDYSFTCQPVDYSDAPKAKRMAAGVWMYYMCKLIELLDTIFFVLRKKQKQVSFLHVYHHTMMPICAYIGVKFLPGGHATLLGLINTFIHILMYFYYFLASMGPRYQKFLWWKRHLTELQIIQFVCILVHNGQLFFRTCDYPKFIAFLLFTQAALFIYLFGSFYYRTYIRPPHHSHVVKPKRT